MTGPTGQSEDQARGRFMVIQLLRLGGVAMVIVALLILNGVIPAPAIVGWALLPIGIVDIFLVPQFLARKWRTPGP